MKLVYLYIKSLYFLRDIDINFGSEKIYKHRYTGEDVIIEEIEQNKNFIPDFFKNKGCGLENITAIVGENATGKSLILNLLIHQLCGDGSSIPDEYSNSMCLPKYDETKITSNSAVIFYSPFYTFTPSVYPEDLIDVSSNALYYKDVNDFTSNRFPSFNHAEFHKAMEFLRQYKLLTQHEDMLKEKGIFIPDTVNIKSIPYENYWSGSVDSYPIKFKTWFNKNWNRSDNTNNAPAGEDYFLEEIRWLGDVGSDSGDDNEKSSKKKWKVYLIWLRHFFLKVVESVQMFPGGEMRDDDRQNPNSWNLSGCDKSEKALEEKPINLKESGNPFNLWGVEDTAPSENFLITFLSNQDIFNDSIVPLIKSMKQLIFDGEIIGNKFGIGAQIHIQVCKEKAVTFLYDHYLPFIRQPSYKKNIQFSGQLLMFNWVGQSTGEISFINFYSRLLEANNMLISRSASGRSYPDYIYLLIDEGEFGFHLKWQRSYVKDLTRFIPKLFVNNDGKSVPIQLIFTTHSPVSLSDIPASNVVLLERNDYNSDKRVIVKSGLDLPQNTFGSNIHDLLRHSFFMGKGYMGLFAEDKINTIINRLNLSNNDKLNEEEQSKLRKEINQIGEPILKLKLLELLNFKMNAILDEVAIIDEKIQILEKHKTALKSKNP
jgi:hypothetical protein